MPSLIYVQHITDIIVSLSVLLNIIRFVFLRIVPHIFIYIPTAYFNIGTKFQREHFITTFFRYIIHYAVGSNKITITCDTPCTYNLNIVYTFTKKHGITEESMPYILLRQIVFRVGIRARVCWR